MTHFGFAIDAETNDLFLDSTNNLATVTGAHAVAQHGRQRLKTFDGEWFLDTEAGVPWLTEILGQSVNEELAEAIVKAELMDTDGVTTVENFSISFDRETRGLDIKQITVGTIYDQEVQL